MSESFGGWVAGDRWPFNHPTTEPPIHLTPPPSTCSILLQRLAGRVHRASGNDHWSVRLQVLLRHGLDVRRCDRGNSLAVVVQIVRPELESVDGQRACRRSIRMRQAERQAAGQVFFDVLDLVFGRGFIADAVDFLQRALPYLRRTCQGNVRVSGESAGSSPAFPRKFRPTQVIRQPLARSRLPDSRSVKPFPSAEDMVEYEQLIVIGIVA